MAISVNNSVKKYTNPTSGSRKSSYKLYLQIIENSYDIATNSSNVSYSGWIEGVNNTTTFYGSKMNGTIKQGDTTLASGSATATSSKPVSKDNKYVLASGSKNFTHDATGELTLTLTFTYSSSASHASAGTTTASITLTKIPRASTIVAVDADIGSATVITVNKASSSFTTSITYKFGSLTGTITSKNSANSIGWTIPTSFYAQIPNAKSGTCTLTATTYNGDTPLGTSTTTFTCRANENNSKPTISSVTITDPNTTNNGLTGSNSTLIRYVSKPKVVVNASARNNATLSKYSILNNNVGTTITSSNTSATYTYTQAITTGNFNIGVTDSRRYITTQNKSVTIINYVPLTINATFSRTDPTSGKMSLSYSGNYFNGSFGSVANTLTVRYRYKEKGASSYSSWVTITPTKNGNTYSQNNLQLAGTFDYQKAYTFEIQALDKISSSGTISKTQDVSQGIPVYWWNRDTFNVEADLYLKGDKIAIPYDVGDIYITTSSVNPSTRFGGTWELFGQGRTLVGYNASDTDFNAIKKTGGNKNMQAHTHTGSMNSAGNHKHELGGETDSLASGSSYARPRGYSSGVLETTYDTNTTGAHTHTLTINSAGTGNSGNLQPYIVVYMWLRIA